VNDEFYWFIAVVDIPSSLEVLVEARTSMPSDFTSSNKTPITFIEGDCPYDSANR
jgi:hypothetical protein